ncbi:hypothetical protein OIU79_030245 [Salix purpurea]|uniref:Uncharacterized protein n=1 Tax=Salix purpurea TaxID=77065 RepID=A0A9Q0SHC6_SALPP|nr:hypothetical protein OIU79_030245 [Salix purpurea]
MPGSGLFCCLFELWIGGFFELLSILGRLVILVLLSAGSECTEVFLGQNSRRRKAPLVRPQPNLFSIVYVVISAMIHSSFILPCLLR